MPELAPAMETIVERCRASVPRMYSEAERRLAQSRLDEEIRLIHLSGCLDALLQIVEFGDQLRRQAASFHLIGAGTSSMLLFLLGFSEVDPILYRTLIQRFWRSSFGHPPTAQFVVLPTDLSAANRVIRPNCVSIHPMTSLEAIPAGLERQVGTINSLTADAATFAVLYSGETEDVFQLASPRAKEFLRDLQPSNLDELVCLTALLQIDHAHSDVAAEILRRGKSCRKCDQNQDNGVFVNGNAEIPILFQETILSWLQTHTSLSGRDAWLFLQVAAKGRLTAQHVLWKQVHESLEHGPNGEMAFERIVVASRYAVCRAHHVANAISTYKAVYFRTHYRKEFDQMKREILMRNEGE